MDDLDRLYKRAEKIISNITIMRSVTTGLLQGKEKGCKLDKKEVLNIAFMSKKLMEKYNIILDEIASKTTSYEDLENIHELIEQTEKVIFGLEESIKAVQKKSK